MKVRGEEYILVLPSLSFSSGPVGPLEEMYKGKWVQWLAQQGQDRSGHKCQAGCFGSGRRLGGVEGTKESSYNSTQVNK